MPSDNDQTANFATIWWNIFRNQRLTARNVLLTALEGGIETSPLRAILQDIAPSVYPGAYSAHKLGRWLARIGGQSVFVGDEIYTFIDRGTDDGGRTWQLISASYERAQTMHLDILDDVAG